MRHENIPRGTSYPALETLGEDLILLSADPIDMRIETGVRLYRGLLGSELIRLVADGHADIVKGRIVPGTNLRLPADPNLAEAFRSIHKSPKAKRWVANARTDDTYLRQLEAAGTVRRESGKSLRVFSWTRWYVADQGRQEMVRRRLDGIVAGGHPLGIEDRSLAGLAYAIGLGDKLYRGPRGKLQRKRLKEIARPKRKSGLFRRQADEAPDPVLAATSASLEAAHQAALDAAVQAAIDQAVGAAVEAAIDAAVDAGSSGGGDGGGGHHG